MLNKIKQDLQNLANPAKAKILQRFFKTGKGQYGEGDKFLGIVVPEQRKVAKKYFAKISLEQIEKLIASDIHEYRQTGLFMLMYKFEAIKNGISTPCLAGRQALDDRKKIYDLYLRNTKWINNWDLVDMTAPQIVGGYLLDKPAKRTILYKLAKSKYLWERRIAILASFKFIKHNEFDDTLKLAEILLNDDHDLIHKAVGWMLREIGKRDQVVEEKFLKRYYKSMPRTMLRYAIEKFEEVKRQKYLKGLV